MKSLKSQKENNVTGARGELLVSLLFPPHWVVRKLERDHGIDLEVEVFRPVSGEDRYETTGQRLYVQVKSSRTPLKTQKFAGQTVLALDSLETPLLRTVSAMGVAVPVILVHIDISTGVAHWVCLNDYFDKYLLPGASKATSNESTKIYFNPRSVLQSGHPDFWMLEVLSQRARMVSMFYLLQSAWLIFTELAPKWQNYLDKPETTVDGFRATSGMRGLNGIFRQILAMNVGRATSVGNGNGYLWPGLGQLRAALRTIDDAVTALYAGDEHPNSVLRKSEYRYLDKDGNKRLVRDHAHYEGDGLSDFLRNVGALLDACSHVPDGFETSARWIGLPFEKPMTAQEAELLYSALRATKYSPKRVIARGRIPGPSRVRHSHSSTQRK